MKTTITKSYETPSGINVKVKGELVLEKVVNLDGQLDTVPACEIRLTVFANGKTQGGIIDELTEHQKATQAVGCTHRVGLLPLMPEHVEIIRNVRKELERHPAWVAKQALIAKNRAEIAEYERTLEFIELQN